MLDFSPSQSPLRVQSQLWDPVLASSHPPSVYQHNVLTFAPSQSATPMVPQYQNHHFQELANHPPSNSGHEVCYS